MLTVAVSVAAGVAALTSIFPALFDLRVAIGVGFVALLWIGNLRGIRESANFFAVPTYVYLVAIYGLLALGLLLLRPAACPTTHRRRTGARESGAGQALGLLLILRAFAAGSVALTGTEAVSNGVPAFRPPEARNAGIVLIPMGVLFGSIFLGISFLASQLGVLPDPTEQETVISQITRTLVGAGTPFHYLSSSRRRSSWSWPPTRPSPTSLVWQAFWARTDSCRASSSSAATGWRSASGSWSWRSSRAC